MIHQIIITIADHLTGLKGITPHLINTISEIIENEKKAELYEEFKQYNIMVEVREGEVELKIKEKKYFSDQKKGE